jgi:hypothetical protein
MLVSSPDIPCSPTEGMVTINNNWTTREEA